MNRVESLLPTESNRNEELSKLRQGPEEPFANFVDRLLTAVVRMISDHQAGENMVKQQAVMSGRPLPLSLIG